MKELKKFRKILPIEKKTVPNFDPNFFTTLRNIVGNREEITSPYEQSIWIYSSTNIISNNVSNAPLRFKSGDNILEETHPLNQLFMSPNPLMSQKDLLQATMIYMGLRGNAFWILDREKNRNGLPKFIWTFDPKWFEPIVDNMGFVKQWRFKGKKIINFDAENVLHFKYFDPNNPIMGIAPWEAARLSVNSDFFASSYNEAFFRNGAAIGGFIESPEELDDDQYTRLLDSINDRHQGHAKAHNMMLLEGGAKFKESKLSQRDMEFIELKKLTKKEIFAAYGTNDVVLGFFEDVKSEAGTKTIWKQFWSSTIIPNQDYLTSVLNAQFVRALDQNLTAFFDRSDIDILQDDLDTQITRAKELFNMGYPINQINDRLNLNMQNVPWGNIGYLPANLIPAGSVIGETDEIESDEEVKKLKAHKKDFDILWKQFIKGQAPIEADFLLKIKKFFKEHEKKTMKELAKFIKMFMPDNLNENEVSMVKDLTDNLIPPDDEKVIKDIFAPLYLLAFQTGMAEVSAELQFGFTFSPLDPGFLQFQELKLTQIPKSIFETLKKQIRKALKDGVSQGESINQIAERISKVYDFAETRSITIARTESASSINAGRLRMYDEAGVKKVQWITARDEFVRNSPPTKPKNSHVALDGQVANVGEVFVNKNGLRTDLRHPGDMNADAEAIINCRCTLIDFEEN